MTTTTADAVATAIATRITAIAPGLHAGDRFREHRYEIPLAEWALANPTGCLRRFSVMPSFDISPPDVTDGLTEAVEQDFLVEVAYPSSHRFGPRGLRDLMAAIDADRSQIAKTVGTNGFASYASEPGTVTIWTVAESGEDLGAVKVGSVRLRGRYFRSATP